jgi:tRNA dimethylallyltransferase
MKKINQKKSNKVIVILGTTGSGKTSLGVRLADKFNGEIISADSRQVYKGMDIGSGKDLGEYKITRSIKGKKVIKKIPYHLIDVVKPQTKFTLAHYQKLALKAIENVLQKGKLPLVVGGTGLYLQAVVDNYQLSNLKPDVKARAVLEKLSATQLFERLQKLNPKFAVQLNNSDRNNPRRLVRYLEIMSADKDFKFKTKKSPYDFLILGLDWPNEILQQRIYKRLTDRLEKENMVGEIKRLHKQSVSWKRLESFGLEYKFVSLYLQNKITYEDMVEKLNTAIFQFAKRQKTWWKRWRKQGRKIEWAGQPEDAINLISRFIKK